MNYTIESIAEFCGGQSDIVFPGSKVGRINIDHRRLNRESALFAALKGARFDGHDFIPEMLDYRVHHFLVSDPEVAKRYQGQANFIIVDNVVKALQKIAAEHRDNYDIPVIAITGSNGKTIVKEWLNTLLELEFQICRSPKSYNSQIGVPLSVFELSSTDSLAIFEAGISQPKEMDALQSILNPTLGVMTNLGDAHSAHFESDQQKFQEKWKLFRGVDRVVCCADHLWMQWLSEDERKKCLSWSLQGNAAQLQMQITDKGFDFTRIEVRVEGQRYSFQIPFTDSIGIENACQCFTVAWALGKAEPAVIDRFEMLSHIAMRMEVKQGIQESLIIDDTYNSDLQSLRASVDHLMSHADRDKWVVLSDQKDKLSYGEIYAEIAEMLNEAEVTRLIAIGPDIAAHREVFDPIKVLCYDTWEGFWNHLDPKELRHKAILVKGARKFKLEKLVNRLQAKQRITTLEIDLRKLGANLNYFRTKLSDRTKVMVMVKAFAYGSGSYEVAHFFQSQRTVDYLVVAYADEGILLREKGITIPIMVMSPSKTSYEAMIQHELEPEIYSLRSLQDFIQAARSMRHFFERYPIHLKIDSGMHRLGFEGNDLDEALELIKETSFIRVASVFTHLSATDESGHDDFTREQVQRFDQANERVRAILGHQPDLHVLNSTGVLRFPQYHYEMVRLGIGLYGFSASEDDRFLNALVSLKSYIVQTRNVKAGESVGYGRKGVSDKDRRIATVALGYADGLDRRLSDGKWALKWEGKSCPIVGNVCMDMTMIDVTHTQAKEGDEVIIFEGSESIAEMARRLDTIPYEILTKIPERVRRVYLQE